MGMTRARKTGIGVAVVIIVILVTWLVMHDGNGVRPANPTPDFKITRQVIAGLTKPRIATDTALERARVGSNAADIYKIIFERMSACYDTIARIGHLVWGKKYSELSQAEKDELHNLMESPDVKEIMDLLQEAANKDFCDWNLDYSKGFEMPLPHLQPQGSLTCLVIGAAFVANDNGDVRGSCDMIELGLKNSGNVGGSDHLLSGMVQIMCDKLMLNCLGDISENPMVSEDQEYALLAEIARRDYGADMVAAVRHEEDMVVALIDKLAGETPETAFGIAKKYELEPEIIQWLADKTYIENNMAKYLEFSELIAELLALPYDNTVKERAEQLRKEFEALPADEFGLAKCFALAQIIARVGEATVGLDAAFTEVATAIFRSRHGRNPKSAAELKEVIDALKL